MKALDLKGKNTPPSIILYGPAGCGKTALASQAKNAYLFDFDNGMRTALNLQDVFTPLRQDTEFDTYLDTSTKTATAYMNFKSKLQDIQNGKGVNYSAYIIDSLTGLCRAIKNHVMCLSGGMFIVPQIQHWGSMVNELESVLTIIRSLNRLMIVTAHENIIEHDNSTLVRIMSMTQNHGTNKLSWLFDEVLYCKSRAKGQGKMDYIVSGKTSSSITTRTRSSINDDIVVNEIGLDGLLQKMGYSQGLEKEVSTKL